MFVDDPHAFVPKPSSARSGAFAVTKGEPVIGGQRGADAHHFFCPHCMTWMFTRPVGFDHIVNVKTGVPHVGQKARAFTVPLSPMKWKLFISPVTRAAARGKVR